MKLLVTGATGFLGAAFAEVALQAGHEVHALLRPGTTNARLGRLKKTSTYLYEAELSDEVSLRAAFTAAKPDVVCHLAWSGVANRERNNPSQVFDNVNPAALLALVAAESGCNAFIGLGSQAEYGICPDVISESQPAHPTTLYGAAKLATATVTERIAGLNDMRWAWLRLFSVYGPDDNPGWLIPGIISQLLEGKEPPLTPGTQKWDYLHIRDAAEGVLAAASSDQAQGVFNLGSGQPVTVRTIAETIRDLIDPGLTLGFGQVEFRPDQVMHLEADITRLKTATGWQPRTPLKDGLLETIESMRA